MARLTQSGFIQALRAGGGGVASAALVTFITITSGVACTSVRESGGAETHASSGAGGRSSADDGAHAGTAGGFAGSGETPSSAGSGAEAAIAEWSDGPGVCPAEVQERELATVEDLEAAARGEGAFADDPPSTCYWIANGYYSSSSNVLLWVQKGGTVDSPRLFVGESRNGVVINGRATIEADEVTIRNLTFDLTGYEKEGSFNTVSIESSRATTLDHVTLTGDCHTGSQGGHVKLNSAVDTVIEACVVEKFGNCGDGHLDHGIYVASAENATIVNSVIRASSSRGIQICTQGGEYGTVDGVSIERNRIYQNGHADYEDGIAINGEDCGTITNVRIERNLIYDNYYSGVRFVGVALGNIVIEYNTFAENGVQSTADGRSEVNLDSTGSGADTLITKNVFAIGHQLLNDCYDASASGFIIEDNAVSVAEPAGDCVVASHEIALEFVDSASGDFRVTSAAVAGYGAYP